MESTNTNNGDVELGSETLVTESVSAGLPLFHISDSQYNEMPCDISNQSLVRECNNDPLAFKEVENIYPAGSFGDKVPVQGSTVVAPWNPSEVSSLQRSNVQNYGLTETISQLKVEIDIKDHFVDMEYLDAVRDQAQPRIVRTSSHRQTIPALPSPSDNRARVTSVVLSDSSCPQVSEMASTFPSAERSSVAPSTRKKGVKNHKCPVCNSLMLEVELQKHLKTHETSAVIETRRSRHSSAADVLKIFPCSKRPFTAMSISELVSEHLEHHKVAEDEQRQAETSRTNTTLSPIASTSTNVSPDPGRVTLLKIARIPVASTPLNSSVERRLEVINLSAGQLTLSNLMTDTSRRNGVTLSLPTESVARDCVLSSSSGSICRSEMRNKNGKISRVGSHADRPVLWANLPRPALDANQSHPSESSNEVLPCDSIPMHPQPELRAASSKEIPGIQQYTSKESALPCVPTEALQLPVPSLKLPAGGDLSTSVPLSGRQETSLRGRQVQEGVTSSGSMNPFGQINNSASSPDSFDGDPSDSGSSGVVGTASSSAPKARKKRAISVDGSSDGVTTAIHPDYIPPSREKLPLKTPQSVLNEIPCLDSLVRKRFVACDSDQETPTPENDCFVCGDKFDTNELLKNHRDERLSNLQCCKCNSKTATVCEETVDAHWLVDHMKCHEAACQKSFPCELCGKVFKRRINLKWHESQHTGVKPFVCTWCGAAFGRKSHLTRHVRVHTGERPYKCDECGKTFVEGCDFKRHLRIHTGERPYKCEYCGMTFIQSSSFVVHKRQHTGERPYQCEICPAAFASNPQIRKHMRTHENSAYEFSFPLRMERKRKRTKAEMENEENDEPTDRQENKKTAYQAGPG